MSANMHSTIPQLRLTVKISAFVIIIFFQFFLFLTLPGPENTSILISQFHKNTEVYDMLHALKHKFVKAVPHIFFFFSFFFFGIQKRQRALLRV